MNEPLKLKLGLRKKPNAFYIERLIQILAPKNACRWQASESVTTCESVCVCAFVGMNSVPSLWVRLCFEWIAMLSCSNWHWSHQLIECRAPVYRNGFCFVLYFVTLTRFFTFRLAHTASQNHIHQFNHICKQICYIFVLIFALFLYWANEIEK